MSWEFNKNSMIEDPSSKRKRRIKKQSRQVADSLTGTLTDKKQLSLFPDSMSDETKRIFGALLAILLLAFLESRKDKSQETSAPKIGEYLLYLFLTKKDRENLIGDLAEEFLEVQLKFGRVAALI